MTLYSFLFRKSRDREALLNSELGFHLQELIDSKVANGLTRSEARRQALLEFGGTEQIKEECRDVHRVQLLERGIANLHAALRFARKSPAFSITVILTMALGIGANSAVFSALDAVLLRPLPFPEADQLVFLRQYNPTIKPAENFVAPVRLEDWNRLNRSFSSITGFYSEDVSEVSGPAPEKLNQVLVAPRFLQVLGVSPALGRDFLPGEAHFGGPNAALISDAYWRRRFHGDPHALGKFLRLGSYSSRVIGVMPANFTFPNRDADLWSVSPPDGPYAQSRESTWFTAVGRLKPGVTIDQGRADLALVETRLSRTFPQTDKNLSAQVRPLKSLVIDKPESSLWLLFLAVSLLLLIACMNIAALLLARTAEREREIAIRYSLGASRMSVISQLLTESLVLAVIGSVAGLVLAGFGSTLFRTYAKGLPRVENIALNWRIALYALGCALISTALFGLLPALQATRRTIAGALAGHSRTQVSGRNRLQWILIGVQVALAVTLLVGAALLLRSFQALGRVSPGFEASHVLVLRVSASWGETVNRKSLMNRIDRDLHTLRNVPGIKSAATSFALPGVADGSPTELKLEGQSDARSLTSDTKVVSDGYFETMRIPLLAGHGCEAKGAWEAAVINRSFAEAFAPGQSALGRHVLLAQTSLGSTPAQIIGVAADARENGINHAPVPIVYWCANDANMAPFFLLRTRGDPESMRDAVRRALAKTEPNRSVFDMTPLEDRLSAAQSEGRLRTWLLSLFALTAILLAAVGLYGTLSYFVSIRLREVGLRIALGALPAQILQRFFAQGLAVALLGCIPGLALAGGLSRLAGGMLYGVSHADPLSYVAAVGIVVSVAAVASVLPAFRASRVDPMRVLRDE